MSIEDRIDNYNTLEKELVTQGYKIEEKTISILKANLLALVTAGPFAVICYLIFFSRFPENPHYLSRTANWIILLLMLICIFVHEMLHGITWGVFCKDKKSISFGVMWRQLTPYCTCAEPLCMKKYLLGGLMPLFILGFGIFFMSLLTGSTSILFLSLLNILGAGGDTTIACYLLKYRKSIIVDHPTECGFVAFYK